jgi:uncharacterized protein YfkK (UPF0435 family)
MCKIKRRKSEHCNTHTSSERCITYYSVIDQHFSLRVKREKRLERKRNIKKKKETIHLSIIDNRDVTMTTTTIDTSNNIYEMVRKKANLLFFKKNKEYFRRLFNLMIKLFKLILVFDMLDQ